jgi:pectinesterase
MLLLGLEIVSILAPNIHLAFNQEVGTIACNGGGSITANNRASASDPAWYVFDTSTITAASGWTTTAAYYLGRPWGVYSRVIFQKCNLGRVINAKRWTTLAVGATPYVSYRSI